jgi:hypothetical protein
MASEPTDELQKPCALSVYDVEVHSEERTDEEGETFRVTTSITYKVVCECGQWEAELQAPPQAAEDVARLAWLEHLNEK